MKSKVYSLSTILLLFIAFTRIQAQENTIPLVFNTGEKFELNNTLGTEIFRKKKLTTTQIAHFTLALHIIKRDTAGKVQIQAQYIKNDYRNEELAKNEITGYNSEMPDLFINASHNDKERSQDQASKEFLAEMLNKPFTIYINEKTGRIEVTGIDTLVKEALKEVTVSDANYLKGYKEGVQKTYSNVMMMERLVSAFNYVPAKPENLADGWFKNVAVGGIVFRVKYNIQLKQPDSISILAEPVRLVNHKRYIATNRMGNVVIEAKTGILIRSSMHYEIKPALPGSQEFLNALTEENELIRLK
jgi:hypothetical protein